MKHEIDFVIAWVDGNDPAWRREKAQYDSSIDLSHDNRDERYRDWNILQYWFRAVEKYAPWVHKIYFVTWGHLPEWLNTQNEKLVIVNHKDFVPAEYLPTFNCNTFEMNFHRIPGLSENFVYFNDDMFLTRPVKPEDFFVDGKPKDMFIMDAILFSQGSVGSLIGNDMELINKYFDKKTQLKKLSFSQLYHPGYGPANLYRNLVLRAWPWFTGFFCDHLSTNFCKSTFEEIWEKEPALLMDTCKDRLRAKTNLNQWLFKFWQLASGNFVPASAGFGRAFHLGKEINTQMLDAIENNRYGVICINDTPDVTNFEEQCRLVDGAFHKILPEKSSFEI